MKPRHIAEMFGDRLAPDGHLVADNFDRWFAGSAVVDAEGRPLVVMHGTWFDFAEFQQSEDIGYHFGSVQAANARLESWADPDGAGAEGANIMPVFLAMRNPLRLRDLYQWGSDDVAYALRDAGLVTEEQADALSEFNDLPTIEAILIAAGYDGIVYENTTEGGGDSYIAMRAGQIKSALGNSGLFDAETDSIDDSCAQEVPAQQERMRS